MPDQTLPDCYQLIRTPTGSTIVPVPSHSPSAREPDDNDDPRRLLAELRRELRRYYLSWHNVATVSVRRTHACDTPG